MDSMLGDFDTDIETVINELDSHYDTWDTSFIEDSSHYLLD